MNGVPIPEVSAGSNQVGAREMWTPQVIWPSGAAAAGPAPMAETTRRNDVAKRRRMVLMVEASSPYGASPYPSPRVWGEDQNHSDRGEVILIPWPSGGE